MVPLHELLSHARDRSQPASDDFFFGHTPYDMHRAAVVKGTYCVGRFLELGIYGNRGKLGGMLTLETAFPSSVFDPRLFETAAFLSFEELQERSLKVHFSSNSDEHSTPQDFFDRVSKKAGGFSLDPCASSKNAKCSVYHTKEANGLTHSWKDHRVWMNPPYSGVSQWMEKAAKEATSNNATVYSLVPARTDTRWWRDHAMKANEIHFITGRLKFGAAKTGAPFPSALVVFHPGKRPGKPKIHLMPQREPEMDKKAA